jgi:hypothetical protein
MILFGSVVISKNWDWEIRIADLIIAVQMLNPKFKVEDAQWFGAGYNHVSLGRSYAAVARA